MSKPFLLFLLVVFIIHLVIFLRLSLRHRKVYHIMAVVTFIFLLISTGLRLAWPEARLGPYPLSDYFRYTAWLTTAVVLIAYLRHRFSGHTKP